MRSHNKLRSLNQFCMLASLLVTLGSVTYGQQTTSQHPYGAMPTFSIDTPSQFKPAKLDTGGDFDPSVKPQLADPEQFRVPAKNVAQPARQSFQDSGFTASNDGGDDLTPYRYKGDDLGGRGRGDEENSLLASLPQPDLYSGINVTSMQKAVANRNVPDPNQQFVGTAARAMDYRVEAIAKTKTWRTPNMVHKPLYFEEANLERYGFNSPRLQPFVSSIHFFSSVALLPYKTGVARPSECEYSMGHFRPGDCHEAYKKNFTFNRRGALRQALAVGTIIGGL